MRTTKTGNNGSSLHPVSSSTAPMAARTEPRQHLNNLVSINTNYDRKVLFKLELAQMGWKNTGVGVVTG